MIIDHIDELELSREAEAKYGNELISLAYLSEGLWFLYHNLRRIEEKVVDVLGNDVQCSFIGSPPGFEWIPQGLVACSFHWYAVSACNYVRLVGWLACRESQTEVDKVDKYVKRVLGPVKTWRNKVGAHFAQTTRHNEDNDATRSASVMFPVGFEDDAFCSQPFTLVLGRADKKSTSRNDMRWGLTHTHRTLAARYWPDVSLT